MRSLPESSPPSGVAGPATPGRSSGRAPARSSPGSSRRLSPVARKWLVVVHLVASVGWLALMLCLLTLAAAALATHDADRLRAAYRAMGLLGDVLVLPLSLLTFGSGVVLGLGTSWGLFRHYWVSTKFWLTLAALGASVFALPDRLHDAVRAAAAHPVGPVSGADLGFVRYNVVIVPSVALALYLFMVVLSVHKPWGRRTRRIPDR
ncbi:DUF2269 domain-containing protein [Streptomyces sp. SP17BM10]|uniref:DUF2269 domain-containing protein n=1 Tax=Streptomyces sp. SP17BM10 TaxID=3002530 RepID=UPI002E77D13E|nr:DUF2269 domain-containing protein [Streptomyces sp. SP17BM10]MEE1788861.1 DUF2269 domain-containing protein [Streptomyces sp. SP17BM10]